MTYNVLKDYISLLLKIFTPFIYIYYGIHFIIVAGLGCKIFGRKKIRMASGSNATGSRSFRSQRSTEEVDCSLPEEIVNVRLHHKQAYTYIAKALEIDESSLDGNYFNTFG